MNNRDFYRKTFSQIHSSSTVNWEDITEMNHTKTRVLKRRLVTIAAAAAVVAALSATAMAVNFMGLRDALLPEKQEVNTFDPETGVAIPGETRQSDAVSLSGYMDSPESKALAEWQSFLNEYDRDKTLLKQADDNPDPSLAQYQCYTVYTQEMAGKLEEIADKYGLKLHTRCISLADHPEALGDLKDFADSSLNPSWMYMYEDGFCHFDGDADIEGVGEVMLQFQRAVKGSFNEVFLTVGNAEAYDQWAYRTDSGVELAMALGPDTSVIFADFPDCFATLNIVAGKNDGMSPESLQALAGSCDFTKLSPVTAPVIAPEVRREPGAADPSAAAPESLSPVEDSGKRAAYAKILRGVLNGVLPDGTAADTSWDLSANKFTLCDVDGDGSQELVLLYSTAPMAGMMGYVIDYKPENAANGGEISIQMTEWPALNFYDNGMVIAEWSHNQTMSKFWPYTLFAYEPVSDSYYMLASVYAADKKLLEDMGAQDQYPAEVDKCGAGTVYYLTYQRYSETEPPVPEEYVLDQKQYDAFLAETLGTARPLDMFYLDLTEENISAQLG